MPQSVIEAIKLGLWDYEPQGEKPQQFPATIAMPGTVEKVSVLADRAEQGLPLWHPSDRLTFEEERA